MSEARMFLRCGNCKYHLLDDMDGSCVCINEKSEFYTIFTAHDEVCDKWEKKPIYAYHSLT